MRISVECGGFTQAADACMAGNQVAAMLTESLSRRLSGYAGMAGNDATSTDFARSYDNSAREALATLTELTHAFIGLGRLITLTGVNHRDAENASAGMSVTGYDGRGLDDDSYLRVSPTPPASSLGHQEPALSAVDRWILDQVEGFLWPDADVDRLHEAAATWRTTAGSVADLTDHLTIASSFLADQRSPEISLALDALDRLKDLIRATAEQLIAVATACEEYADAVEVVHTRTRALLEEIAKMIVEGAAISVLATAMSGGLGGGAAASAAISRITAQTPRFHALLGTLRITAIATGTRLRTARRQLTDLRERIEKYANVPVRTDRGSMKNPLTWRRGRGPGWLKAHEGGALGSHTLNRHVGKSVTELQERLASTRLKQVSTFSSEEAAERFIAKGLRIEARQIRDWLSDTNEDRLRIFVELGDTTGTAVKRSGDVAHPTGVRIVLDRDHSAPNGWRIKTAFPD